MSRRRVRAAALAVLPLLLSGCSSLLFSARGEARAAAPPASPTVASPEAPPTAVRSFEGVGDTIYFAKGSAQLSAAARDALRAQAVWLAEHARADSAIRLEGNTDWMEAPTEDAALALGVQRVLAALDRLVELGVPRQRITIQTNGAARPRDPRTSEAAMAVNRNVTTVLVEGR